MTERAERDDFSHLWFESWKLHAVLLAFFTLSLVKPLSSSAPLVAVYFPGAFIAISGWSIIRHVSAWSPVRMPVRTQAPVAFYMAAATATLVAARATTGRDVYRTAALGSLWLTVPMVALTTFALFFRRRRAPERTDVDRQG